MPMFFLQFSATPRHGACIAHEAGGALVNCWIERPNLEEAIGFARRGIEAEGWNAGEPDLAHAVDAAAYPPRTQQREYFEQALIDKEVLVFHTYPKR
jgi:hypothetical protein